MKTELEVLKGLQSYIAAKLNTYIEQPEDLTVENITIDNVFIDYPDTDNMKCSTMFYIVPDIENYSNQTMSSDLAVMDVTIYLLSKKDKQESLITKVFTYFTALYRCLKADISLNSIVDTTNLITMEFYPAVEANKSIVGMEIKIQMEFTKDY